jgi:hypothetical protein
VSPKSQFILSKPPRGGYKTLTPKSYLTFTDNDRLNTTPIRSLKKAGFDPFPDDAMIETLKDK